MRGTDRRSGSLFSYVDMEARVPKEHPLRRIRELVNGSLLKLDTKFSKLYSNEGPSVPPERLLPASLLQVFYSIRWCSQSVLMRNGLPSVFRAPRPKLKT